MDIWLPPVARSWEFLRISAIPEEAGSDPALYPELRDLLTRPDAPFQLRDEQCDALLQAMVSPGLFGALAVGKGKTLLAALLPTVLDKRAVILAPSGLLSQMAAMLLDYQRWFRVRDDITLLAYETLSRKEHSQSLETLVPELVIADECHKLANPASARTRRFLRFMRSHPTTTFCALSGTITKRSIKDFAHLLAWTHKDWNPLPRDWPTLTEWAEALDVCEPQRPPGVLTTFCHGNESAREGWQRRFRLTRGIVASQENEVGSTLILKRWNMPEHTELEAKRRQVIETWESPDGDLILYQVVLFSVLRQLRLGGYYEWIWPDSVSEADRRWWLDARRAWFMDAREVLRSGYALIDSLSQVADAVDAGKLDLPSLEAWREASTHVEGPGQRWHWITTDIVDQAIRGIDFREIPCVIWTDLAAIGNYLNETFGIPFYGRGPKAAEKILAETADRTICASIQAHGTGRNLQAYSVAYVLGGPVAGRTWEQLLGRLHRSGQTADEVVYHIAFWEDIQRGCADANYIQETTGNQQKLLYAIKA